MRKAGSILSAHNSRSSCLASLVTRISSFPLMTSLSHQRRGARRYGWFDAYHGAGPTWIKHIICWPLRPRIIYVNMMRKWNLRGPLPRSVVQFMALRPSTPHALYRAGTFLGFISNGSMFTIPRPLELEYSSFQSRRHLDKICDQIGLLRLCSRSHSTNFGPFPRFFTNILQNGGDSLCV